MKTPIADFLREYQKSNKIRFHMPGHKGVSFLGCESLDLTEVKGADALYEADGIIAESESNASLLFGSARTLYSTEGSSQCIRAMLYLAVCGSKSRTVVAARNVHKVFVYATALLDFDIVWLMPEESASLCACPISAERLERTLQSLPEPPAAVYITTVDYLGNVADTKSLAEVCHKYGTYLLCDNAHGAYLHFLTPSQHPLDLGADICCDSAHKTLPVLTGGAYLHISKNAPASFAENAKKAMALFGSTSPSYLTLASLDECNRYLSDNYSHRLSLMTKQIGSTRKILNTNGWQTEETDPLRITIKAPEEMTGNDIAEKLRTEGIECEYSDPDFCVLMLTPENTKEELFALESALKKNSMPYKQNGFTSLKTAETVISVRKALFASSETVKAENSIGRVCGAPTVSCPPAIPIAVSGEKIDMNMLRLFEYYGINEIEVLK